MDKTKLSFIEFDDTTATVKLPEELLIGSSELLLKEIGSLRKVKLEKIVIDYSDLTKFDSILVVMRGDVIEFAEKSSIEFEEKSQSEEAAGFIKMLTAKDLDEPPHKKTGLFKQYVIDIGNEFLNITGDAYEFIEFTGKVFIKTLAAIVMPWKVRWKDFPLHFTRSGVNSVPIVVMILFLLGLITGYQGALQLSQFGADIYIADLIGISITRELSPLMVAIIIAGRSGSSFAAEIGTMKVSEEVDALKTMGFDIINFLVLPRILAVTVAMPILTLICDLAGVAGGLIAAINTLDITIVSYINQLQGAVVFADIGTGLVKSVAFGYLIALVGCFRGLQVSSGADSVGKYTTASVVTSIFMIIIVDSIFVLLFQALGV